MDEPLSITRLAARMDPAMLAGHYERWLREPASVDSEWAAFFEGFDLGRSQGGGGLSARVTAAVAEWRARGHLRARTDPLEDAGPDTVDGFFPEEMAARVSEPGFLGGREMPLRELLETLAAAYAGPLGCEFEHVGDVQARQWLRDRAEARPCEAAPDAGNAASVLRWVLEAEAFEQFLGRKFLGERRFSLEGAEGVMVALNALLEACPAAGVREIEMGMSHRGRLNVLANFVRKTLTTILYEFTSGYEPGEARGAGDVKYHLGYENHRDLDGGRVRIHLAANPGHLEAVDAIVEGRARARQELAAATGGDGRAPVLPLLLHGDAAFAGQGVVAETLNLARLPGYGTGGTVHLVINNRIGFTTPPGEARSTRYATEIAKVAGAPVFHVNGEDAAALVWAARTALGYRQRFGGDVVLDIVCHRRHGHSETDQPGFTQPLESRLIEGREPFGERLKREWIAAGAIDAAEAGLIEETIWAKLEAGYHRMMEMAGSGRHAEFSGTTAIIQPPYDPGTVSTGIEPTMFARVAEALTGVPEGFTPHPLIARRLLPGRAAALAGGGALDWPLAEAMAFGSLLLENITVRLSGQDSERGAFSQRHAVWHDFTNGSRYVPLARLAAGQARFEACNSPLSQAGVLGFDYGYSLAAPGALTIWEAQFGDFANGAQVVIDQFIASGEAKWQTPTDLVLLLPHGHEGMGPEHSSARLERFLQLCADDNLIVANCSTPAQYFHILRRQKLRPFRKPLALMMPKTLLFRKEAVSPAARFLTGSCFHEVLPDDHGAPGAESVRRVVFCSGKIYFELCAHRRETGVNDTAIVRIEQLHPFPSSAVAAALAAYPAVSGITWCQEEPANMGAWDFVRHRLERIAGHPPCYAGRPASASPATGSRAAHFHGQRELVAAAFAGH